MDIKHARIGIALIASVGSLRAQRASIDATVRTSDKSYVQATGEATVSAKPDQAVIDIGVVTQGATAVSAAAQNAKDTDAVLADLRKILAGSQQLKTTGYSVRPNYQYPKPGAQPTITSYIATNVVEATVTDLTQVGKVIDTAIQSGANNIQKLQFGLKNAQAARVQALREASGEAEGPSTALAKFIVTRRAYPRSASSFGGKNAVRSEWDSYSFVSSTPKGCIRSRDGATPGMTNLTTSSELLK